MDDSINNDMTLKRPAGDNRSVGNGHTLPPRPAGQPGRRFRAGDVILGRYRVMDELGQGGMGVVYRCHDEVAGLDVALKALPPEVAHNSGEMEEVRENFRLVSKLHHPNIANVNTLERDTVTGDCYLVMECVDGLDLRQWARKRRSEGRSLTLDEVTVIAHRVASALDYAHEQKIIHRDIKPSNVRVNFEGEVKVLDFGLAAQFHTSLSRVSQAYRGTSGTGPYMAPEQWQGRRQDAAADQYALAASVYELLCGVPPFENHDLAILREAVLRQEVLTLENVPPYVNAALQRALAKEPGKRYPDCAAFVAALSGKGAEKPLAPAAGAPAPGKGVQKPERPLAGVARKSWLRGVWLAALLALAAAVCYGSVAAYGAWAKASQERLRTRRDAAKQAFAEALAQVRLPEGPAGKTTSQLLDTYAGAPWNERIARLLKSAAGGDWAAEAAAWQAARMALPEAVRTAGEAIQAPVRVTVSCSVRNAEITDEAGTCVGQVGLPLGLRPWKATEWRVRAPGYRTAQLKLPPCEAGTDLARQVSLDKLDKPVKSQPWLLDLGKGVSAELAWIPPGETALGSAQGERDWASGADGRAEPRDLKGEGAAKQIRVANGFWLGQTEVTVGQWRRFVALTGYSTEAENAGKAWVFDQPKGAWAHTDGKSWRDPGFSQTDDHPAVCVSWNDANAFCAWLNDWEREAGRIPEGFEYRLSGEAEWAYACRGGREGVKFWWGDALSDGAGRLNGAGADKLSDGCVWRNAYSWEDGYGFTAPGGAYGAKGMNGFGLSDMLGNVWEWCDDACDEMKGPHETVWHGEVVERAGAGDGFVRREDDSVHIIRGGSFRDVPGLLRCACRKGNSVASADVGFRLCLGVRIGGGRGPSQPKAGAVSFQAASQYAVPLAGKSWRSPATGMSFVWVPALKIWVGRYEVTNEEFGKMQSGRLAQRWNDYKLDEGRQPVSGLGFAEAKQYAVWLTGLERNRLGGASYRLPTEGEWVAFAQCGDGREYPWGDAMPPKYGNYADAAAPDLVKATVGVIQGYCDWKAVSCSVEKSGSNEWGLYGVGGNVWEFCVSDTGAGVAHGASWMTFETGALRCASRKEAVGDPPCDFGFRLVLSR